MGANKRYHHHVRNQEIERLRQGGRAICAKRKVYSTELTQFCVSARAMALPWGCPLPKLFGERYTLDLVLASDVVYHEDVVGTLFSTLLDL